MKITTESLKNMGAEYDKEMNWWNLSIGVINYRFAGQDGSWGFGRADYADDMGWLPERDRATDWMQFIFFVYELGLKIGAADKLAAIHRELGLK